VELHVLDVELDELVRRSATRYADAPHTTAEICADQLAVWASSFEAPTDDERRLFDTAWCPSRDPSVTAFSRGQTPLLHAGGRC